MSEFVDYLSEVFEQFGNITSRKMFGGYGIYHNDIMFGLVAEDTLFLKTDKTTIHYFEKLDLAQFEYKKNGKMIKMSYYQAPEDIFDDPEQATLWAKRAYNVAALTKSQKTN